MKFPSYGAYKESGVDWLGRIPESWSVRKLGSMGKLVGGVGFPHEHQGETKGEIPFFKVSDTNLERNHVYLKEFNNSVSHEVARKLGAKICSRGTIVFPKVGATLLSNKRRILDRGSVFDNNMAGFIPRKGDSKYWYYWLSELDFGQIANPGAVPSINENQLRELPALIPSLSEQQKIAQFLDYQTAKIDRLIEKQQRLLELLDEKSQAAISQAVTKGLDPDRPMTYSGLEWLGNIPANWEVLNLSRITKSKCDGPFGSGIKTEHYADKGARVVRLQNIRAGWFDATDAAFIDEEYARKELAKHEVRSGDLLIAGLGDERYHAGRACVAPEGIEPAVVKADCYRFKLDYSRASPRFIAYQLTSTAAEEGPAFASGTTRTRISLSPMSRRYIALPPLWEQEEIANHIDEIKGLRDQLADRARRAIILLQEHRGALISSAVTGKIDVRNWQAPVNEPEESDPAEALHG